MARDLEDEERLEEEEESKPKKKSKKQKEQEAILVPRAVSTAEMFNVINDKIDNLTVVVSQLIAKKK